MRQAVLMDKAEAERKLARQFAKSLSFAAIAEKLEEIATSV
jgi:hypothetical protein